MGIWDKVKETSKTIGQKAGHGVKVISDELARRQEEARLKDKLLGDFSLADLKGFCKFYGYSDPDPTYEDANGRTRHRKPDRGDWFDLCKNKSIDKLKKYAEKDRRISQDARDTLIEISKFQAVTTATSQKDMVREESKESAVAQINTVAEQQKTSVLSSFDEILSVIENNYENAIRDQFFTDEDQFNDNLVSYLRAKFGDKYRIENTRKLHRDNGDIFIDGKYVLELKYADSIGTLDKGATEAKRYKEKGYPGVAFVILDVGKLTSSLAQYKRWYEDEGAKVIILRGKGERKKPKKIVFIEKP